MDKLSLVLDLVRSEYLKAAAKHPPMHSLHEGKAVIEEELDELWDEIKLRSPDYLRITKEATHVAAMALRFLIDQCPAYIVQMLADKQER